MKRSICFLIAVCLLLLASSALADLKRGSSGDEVAALQQQMIDVGALDDIADGKFGKKTEKAVRSLQTYFGLKVNGRANDSFMDELSLLWYALQDEETGSMELSDEEMAEQHMSCYPTEAETEYCPRHELFPYLESLLERNGRAAPDGVQLKIYQRIATLAHR